MRPCDDPPRCSLPGPGDVIRSGGRDTGGGGGWTEGNKEEAAWAGWGLATFGFVAVAINYRLAPEYEYPAALEDVEAAIRWLRKPRQRDAYGIDPARVAVAGGSAGGHLAMLVAAQGRGRPDRGTRVAAVVSWSGPMDLTLEAALVDSGEHDASSGVPVFLGCEEEHCPERWAREASPFTYVDPTDPPMLFTSRLHRNARCRRPRSTPVRRCRCP